MVLTPKQMNSKFSDFFRNATYEEKERVWKEIIRKVNKEQQAIINQSKQMNEKKRKISKKAARVLKDLGIRLIHLAPVVDGGFDNMSYGAITEVYNDLMHELGFETWSDIN